jgi:hypothetical protein
VARKGMTPDSAHKLISSVIRELEGEDAAKLVGPLVDAAYQVARQQAVATGVGKDFEIATIAIRRASRDGKDVQPEVFRMALTDHGGDGGPGWPWPFPFSGCIRLKFCLPPPWDECYDIELCWWFP